MILKANGTVVKYHILRRDIHMLAVDLTQYQCIEDLVRVFEKCFDLVDQQYTATICKHGSKHFINHMEKFPGALYLANQTFLGKLTANRNGYYNNPLSGFSIL